MKKLELWYPIDLKPFIVSQRFGENLLPLYAQLGMKGHNGWDMICDHVVVRAAHDGIVTYAGEDGSNGYLVVIRTEDEREWVEEKKPSFFKTLYAHLDKDSIKVVAGQRVAVGTVLAISDNTGASSGPHLHFGLKPVYPGEEDWQWFNLEPSNGYNGAIDPEPYWNGKYASEALALTGLIGLLAQLVGLYQKLIGQK